MTTRNYLETYLEQRGMSFHQAVLCTDFCIDKLNAQIEIDDNFNDYKITWNRPSDEYPNVLLRTLTFMMNPNVLEWIEENIPNAWFKRVFDNSISE